MKVWAQWWGGHNYSRPYDYEEFSSLSAAKEEFQYRFCSRRYPCVSESDANMLIYTYDPRHERDAYPDFELVRGPRGGTVQRTV